MVRMRVRVRKVCLLLRLCVLRVLDHVHPLDHLLLVVLACDVHLVRLPWHARAVLHWRVRAVHLVLGLRLRLYLHLRGAIRHVRLDDLLLLLHLF